MQDLLQQPQTWQARGPTSDNGNRPNPPLIPQLWLWVGGAVAAGVVLLGAIAAVVQPSYQSYDEKVVDLQNQLAKGNTANVVALADVYLSQKDISPESLLALAGLRYTAAMQETFNHSELSADATVLRWHEAEAKADEEKVPPEKRWSPMEVFDRGYRSTMYALARAGFRTAWRQGLVGPTDRNRLAGYYASWLNDGNEQLRKGDSTAGLQAVATAAAISRAYNLPGQGEAALYLTVRFGRDERKWPAPDQNDPILNQTRSEGRLNA